MGTKVIQGDVFDVLPTLKPGSVDCVVTSPPYFRLRSYLPKGHPLKALELGCEPTVEGYVANMVRVLALVREVMAEHATCWLNCGDTHATGGGAGPGNSNKGNGGRTDGRHGRGLADGNLCLVPWRLALALQADGWLVRSVVCWAKDCPMPESVSGWAWRRCRVKVGSKDMSAVKSQKSDVAHALPQKGLAGHSRGAGGYIPAATWADCPGCPKCEKAGGYVLRRGSWRPTRSWEPILMLAKSPHYFADGEPVKTSPAAATVGRDRYTRVLDDPGEQFAVRHDHETACVTRANARDVQRWSAEPLREAHYACVDAETECLTAAGWKRHDQLQDGDLAAQFDMESETLSWGPILAVHRYEVADEEIVAADKAKRLSFAFTKNHRCVIRRRTSPKPTFVDAIDLKAGHQIVTHAAWEPGGAAPLSEEWAELLGWYIAEGHECKNTSGVHIYQSLSANAEHASRIEALLRAVGAEFQLAAYRRQYRGRPTVSGCFLVTGFAAYRLRGLAPGKEMPGDCLTWDAGLARAFLRGLIDGDGHTRRFDGRRWFVQKNKRTADFVQALLLRTGVGASVIGKAGGLWEVSETSVKTWTLRGTNGKYTELPLARYTGTLWCITTTKGTWLARKNGRHFITGNSFPTALAAWCLRCGTSARGYCPLCGRPWARVLRTAPMVLAPSARCLEKQADGLRTACGGAVVKDAESETIGWRPTCKCPEHEPRRGLVLDPFAGSCRTGIAALRLGLDFVGIELSPEYAAMGRRLLHQDSPLFAGEGN